LGIKVFRNFDFSSVQMFPFTGLFHRAISQSGSATCTWAVTPKGRPKVLAEQVAGLFDCPVQSSQQLISCLKEQDPYKVYGANDMIEVSCHKQPKSVMKLKSDKSSNTLVEYSRPGSTN
jgi:carboxylesterase type B